jgi:peptidoglycan hydrolase-like protein with peptidoglycan-binding domain
MATEAFRLATSQPVAPSPVEPPPEIVAPPLVVNVPPPVNPAEPPSPVNPPQPAAPPVDPGAPPGPVLPYPGTGAWSTNSGYVARYQKALTWLALAKGHPTWNPGAVDGKYGPKTQAAVKAFQSGTGLAADGEAGSQTAAALDAAMGLAPLAAPIPVPVAPPPVAPPAAMPAGPPALVGPYPGTGAWQKNTGYIARYQSGLMWLAASKGHPTWSPGAVDGKYGPKTAAAVKAFQGGVGLPVDGECGPTTAAAIDHLLQGG